MRRLADDRGWAFTLPPCAAERIDDLDEVRQMLEAGEGEIATDELRYLLSGCPELLDAHVLLGHLALAEGDAKPADVELARGHYGFAYQLGEKAIQAAGCPGPIPGDEPDNQPWHESARGVAWCLEKQGRGELADRVAATIRKMDPSDPAGVKAALDELRGRGGLSVL